jgi:hypothetical protein
MRAADVLLIEAAVPHATVSMEALAGCWPVPAEDPVERAAHMYRNLASLWADYASRRAERLMVELLVENRSELEPLHDAIPGADITIVRLRAPAALIEARVRAREPYPDDELCGARWWIERMDERAVEDFLIDNGPRPLRQVAAEVLTVAGWLTS